MKKRNRGGRPPGLTLAVAIELGRAFGRGHKFEAACKAAGVPVSTGYRWMARARAGDPRFTPLLGLDRPAAKTALDDIFATIMRGGIPAGFR